MKVAIVALFAAGALAGVVPVEDNYGAPIEDNYAPAPVEDDYATVPVEDDYATVPVEDDYAAPTTTSVASAGNGDYTGKKWYTSTVYETQVHTVTDCPPEVTDCPAESHKVITKTVAVSTTLCPEDDYPVSTGSFVPVKPTTKKPHGPKPTGDYEEPSKPKPTKGPEPSECVPTTKVKTISTSVTKVVPTVIYETVTEGCAEPTKGPSPPKNGTTAYPPTPKPSKPVETAGASTVVGSVLFAAVAGLAAFAFA